MVIVNSNIFSEKAPFVVAIFAKLSAIFNFQSLISVILLLICTCAYVRAFAPRVIDRNKEGLLGVFWKCARIGERLSPWVSISCFCMAFVVLFL
ncbi:unnamed protein product [Caenorhabditis sp. 36 PRJEB53466]|nr:unnamed protein product [Caenorhabditis sp. 36 PRJEB53466]